MVALQRKADSDNIMYNNNNNILTSTSSSVAADRISLRNRDDDGTP